MYGSSLMIETERPRLFNSRPMLAAVMPLPSEEVTPPVTKTYFAIGSGPPGFFECYSKDPPARSPGARSGGRRGRRERRPARLGYAQDVAWTDVAPVGSPREWQSVEVGDVGRADAEVEADADQEIA